MIIKGASRSNGLQLGAYLLGEIGHDNDRITVLDVNHLAGNVRMAVRDMQAATGTGQRGSKGLYHAQISPAPGEDAAMTVDDWLRCADVLEAQLGLEGQPRALVLHEKEGRQHLHVAWQRYDYARGNLRSDSWTYIKHELAARQLEKELGHAPVKGPHLDGPEHRNAQSYDMAAGEQAARSDRDPAQLKDAVAGAWQDSDTAQSFSAALADQGLILAKGDRRAFVIVDEAGEVYSLNRQLRGTAKAAGIKARLADLDSRLYPSVNEARDIQRNLNKSGRLSAGADRMARRQAGQRVRLDRKLRATGRSFIARQKKELARYDQAAGEMQADQEALAKPPGKLFALFLRSIGRYDRHMDKLEQQAQQRKEDALAARMEFRQAQQQARTAFKTRMRRTRRKLLESHIHDRAVLPEREQGLMKDRIHQYMLKYRGIEPERDQTGEGEGQPGGKIILPPSQRSPEERAKWEKEKRRRAEARQRKEKDKDHDR